MPNPNPRKEFLLPIKSRWKHTPTTRARYPELFSSELEAIALLADSKDDPVEFLQRLLAIGQQMDK